jgi:hypothetical protein
MNCLIGFLYSGNLASEIERQPENSITGGSAVVHTGDVFLEPFALPLFHSGEISFHTPSA